MELKNYILEANVMPRERNYISSLRSRLKDFMLDDKMENENKKNFNETMNI